MMPVFPDENSLPASALRQGAGPDGQGVGCIDATALAEKALSLADGAGQTDIEAVHAALYALLTAAAFTAAPSRATVDEFGTLASQIYRHVQDAYRQHRLACLRASAGCREPDADADLVQADVRRALREAQHVDVEAEAASQAAHDAALDAALNPCDLEGGKV